MTQLFDDLVKGGAAAVRGLVGRSEALDLDFKQRSQNSKEDRKVLGKALSAFANSMGGMIVWGVDCRRDPQTGLDEVSSFVPIKGLARFASEMQDLTVEALMPRHAGIRVHALDEGGDTGFLLVDIERSERRPHRCEFGDKVYYRRTGSSSRVMEHFEIEDAFRRTSLPDLQLEHRIQDGGASHNSADAQSSVIVALSLRNVSKVSARHAYAATFQSVGCNKARAQAEGITVREQPPQRFFEIETGIIHPDVSRLVAPLQLSFTMKYQQNQWILRRDQLTMEFVVAFGCLDSPMRTTKISLSEAELIANIFPSPVYIV